MTEDQKIYYVYKHIDPRTEKIVYVGKGIYGRAWDVTRCTRYTHQHTLWMKGLSEKGFLPPDWVWIVRRNLSNTEAFEFERELINFYSPAFNMAIRGSNNHMSVLKEEQVVLIKQRLKNKEPHHAIAADFGVKRGTISMISTGRNWKHVL